jgi:hypothetical protein
MNEERVKYWNLFYNVARYSLKTFKQIKQKLKSLSYMLGVSDGKFKIFDEYKLHEHADKLMIVEYGEWDPNEGMTVYEEDIWKRRSNLKGHQIR